MNYYCIRAEDKVFASLQKKICMVALNYQLRVT